MRVGIDVDGCLANFNSGFIRRVIEVTGRNLFPDNYEPTTWDYPTAVGYTEDEVNKVWENIQADPLFWLRLPVYQGTCGFLMNLARQHHDVYFITARPGIEAKMQTELWLEVAGYESATVLITSKKGLAARTLDLDIYLDDRWENAKDVAVLSDGFTAHGKTIPPRYSTTKTFLLDRPWNRLGDETAYGVTRIASLSQFPL